MYMYSFWPDWLDRLVTGWRFSHFSYPVLGAAAILLFLYACNTWSRKPRNAEPPYIYPSLPFVGHIIGMMRYGAKYFELVNKNQKHPIFTLPMLTTRNYIVSNAILAGHIQRNAKTLSFYSLIVEVTRRLIAFDKNAAQVSMYNMNGEHGPGGLMAAVHEMMNRLLAPGPYLDSITVSQMERMSEMLNHALPEGAEGEGIITNLYAWQRHIFSICNAYAIYGAENIFAMHPELETEFWKFEDGMLGLVVDIVPSITARKAHLARRKVLDGLVEYVKKESYKRACPLIQERVGTNLSFGMSAEMAGHAELILMFGILGNAVPSCFWLISQIFSRPKLLEAVREGIQSALDLTATPSNEYPSNEKSIELHISSKKINIKSCPLLYSCYRETLRDISLLTSARLAVGDTYIPHESGSSSAPSYLLRKNSIVQIAGGIIHQDPSIWGPNSTEFVPDRFIHLSGEATPLPAGVPSSAFRAYGGGTVICPGRHFAQSELMTLAAVLALGFDITEVDGTVLKLPQKDDTRIPLSVMKPVYDPKVRIRRRSGWETVIWDIGL